MSWQHLEFCHAKSDSIYPVAMLSMQSIH